MRQVYEIDVNGYYIEPVMIEDDRPENYVEEKPQNGLYRPKWTGDEWVEDMSTEEIDEINYMPPQPPSDKERIEALEDTILFLLGGM